MHRRLSLPFALALLFLTWLTPPGTAQGTSGLPDFSLGSITGLVRIGTAGNILLTVPITAPIPGLGQGDPLPSPFGTWGTTKGCGPVALCPEGPARIPEIDINVSDVMLRDFCKAAMCPPEFFQRTFGFTMNEAQETADNCRAVAPTEPGTGCSTTFERFCAINPTCTALQAEMDRRVLDGLRRACPLFPRCLGPLIATLDDPSTDTPEQAEMRRKHQQAVDACKANCTNLKAMLEDAKRYLISGCAGGSKPEGGSVGSWYGRGGDSRGIAPAER